MLTKRECVGIAALVLLLTLIGVSFPLLFSQGSWVSEFERNQTLSAEVDDHPLLKKYR